jgi:hypothetical protein
VLTRKAPCDKLELRRIIPYHFPRYSPLNAKEFAMKNSISRPQLLGLMLLAPALTSCGSKSDSKPQPVIVYGKMTVTTTSSTDAGTFELTALSSCKRNADTGRVDVIMSQGAGKPGLSFAIKDYSSTAKPYTCTQSLDNQSSTTDLGGKFESCMVAITVPSTATATTLNGYSMHRDALTVKPFNYSGACSIQVTEASPATKGTIVCSDMVQTQLEGLARNPIDTSTTADVTAEFNCTFQ